MFDLASFSFGSIAIGVVISLVAFMGCIVIIRLCAGNRTFTPVSYLVLAATILILLVLNVVFCGLVRSKHLLDNYQQTSEYQLLQRGGDALNAISPDLYDIATIFIGEEHFAEAIETQKSRINQYLWADGIVCVLIFMIGVCITCSLMTKSHHSANHHTGRHVPAHDNF